MRYIAFYPVLCRDYVWSINTMNGKTVKGMEIENVS